MTADACAAAVQEDPATGAEAARAWARAGGGGEAVICEALALEAMGALVAGAALLERLASKGGDYLPRARAGFLEVASGWLLRAGRAEAARAAAEAGLRLDAESPRLLTRRAAAAEALGERAAALADLDAALEAEPTLPGARLLRARLRREDGAGEGALADAEAALTAAPDDAVAWLEAGRALVALGRDAEARERLLGAVARDREGPAGAAARTALQRMALEDGAADATPAPDEGPERPRPRPAAP